MAREKRQTVNISLSEGERAVLSWVEQHAGLGGRKPTIYALLSSKCRDLGGDPVAIAKGVGQQTNAP